MKEIIILDELPVVFTKDRSWQPDVKGAKHGRIIYLPADAILVMLPKLQEIKQKKI